MSINIKRLHDLSTIVLEVVPPIDPAEMPVVSTKETAAFQQELDRPVFRVLDLSQGMQGFTFSNMMIVMAEERGKAGGADDPNVTTLFIGSGDLVRIGTEALKQQEQYGQGRVYLFETQEAALEFVKEQMGGK